jgi:lysophospholipase L1-like esterase|nr:SGNH/GDSL hydrolase family protein [Rhodococcus erythropolis]
MGNFISWFERSYKGIIIVLVAIMAITLVVLAMQQVNASKPAAGAEPGPVPTFTSKASIDPLQLPKNPQVLVIGDSYAQGTGASSDAARWTTLLAEDQGWDAKVDGIGGTGFTWGGGDDGKDSNQFSTRIAAHAKDKNIAPALVILEGGQNDYRADASDLVAAVKEDVQAVRAAWPDAEVIVIGPAAPEPLATEIERMDTSVEAGARAADAYSINPRATKWFNDENSAQFNFDGAHVNDGGHKLIAAKVGEALDQFTVGADPTF